MERFDKGGHGKIWQDLTRETCQNLARFGKTRQDLTRGGMARFGKIWQDLTKGDMARFGKIWQIDVVKIWQDVARFDKGDMARCRKI